MRNSKRNSQNMLIIIVALIIISFATGYVLTQQSGLITPTDEKRIAEVALFGELVCSRDTSPRTSDGIISASGLRYSTRDQLTLGDNFFGTLSDLDLTISASKLYSYETLLYYLRSNDGRGNIINKPVIVERGTAGFSTQLPYSKLVHLTYSDDVEVNVIMREQRVRLGSVIHCFGWGNNESGFWTDDQCSKNSDNTEGRVRYAIKFTPYVLKRHDVTVASNNILSQTCSDPESVALRNGLPVVISSIKPTLAPEQSIKYLTTTVLTLKKVQYYNGLPVSCVAAGADKPTLYAYDVERVRNVDNSIFDVLVINFSKVVQAPDVQCCDGSGVLLGSICQGGMWVKLDKAPCSDDVDCKFLAYQADPDDLSGRTIFRQACENKRCVKKTRQVACTTSGQCDAGYTCGPEFACVLQSPGIISPPPAVVTNGSALIGCAFSSKAPLAFLQCLSKTLIAAVFVAVITFLACLLVFREKFPQQRDVMIVLMLSLSLGLGAGLFFFFYWWAILIVIVLLIVLKVLLPRGLMPL